MLILPKTRDDKATQSLKHIHMLKQLFYERNATRIRRAAHAEILRVDLSFADFIMRYGNIFTIYMLLLIWLLYIHISRAAKICAIIYA